MVQRTLIRPPMSRVGPLNTQERRALIEADVFNQKKYKELSDGDTAHERLQDRNTIVGKAKEGVKSAFGGLFKWTK